MNVHHTLGYCSDHSKAFSFSRPVAVTLRLAGSLLALGCATALAQIRVTTSGGADPETNDGSTWEKAISGGELAQRLSGTSRGGSGGEYWLEMGVYPPLRPHRGTALYGGFSGQEETRNERDPGRNQTTLTGIILGEYALRTSDNELVEYQVPGSSTLIDGCTLWGGLSLQFPGGAELTGAPLIKNCKIQGSAGYGSVVMAASGPLKLEDCEIFAGQGAGVSVNGLEGRLEILRCHIHNNGGAGIVAVAGARLTVNRSVIENNGAGLLSDCCGRSSGIWIQDTSAEIAECEIRNNTGWSGAGVRIFLRPPFEGRVVVRDTSITGNTATDASPNQGGGGIHSAAYQAGRADRVVITNCVVAGNTTAGWGGGVYLHGYGTRVIACTITGNHADKDGGGLFFGISPNTYESSGLRAGVRSTVIAGNTAQGQGGGLAVVNTDPEIINCTVVANAADGNGGAVYNFLGRQLNPSGPVRYNPPLIANSVLSGNAAAEGTVVYHSIGFFGNIADAPPPPALDHCAYPIDGSFKRFWQYGPLTDIAVADSSFPVVDPAWVNAPAGDYQLASSSPLIDRGNHNYVMLGERDRVGAPRLSGAAVDVGAYELGTPGARIWLAGAEAVRQRVSGVPRIRVNVTLENPGTANANQLLVTSATAHDEFGQPCQVADLQLANPDPNGSLLVGQQATVRLSLAPTSLTQQEVRLVLSGQYQEGGTAKPFELGQVLPLQGSFDPPITVQLSAGLLRIQFTGQLQWTTSLLNPNWQTVSAPGGELEVTPTGKEEYWRILE